MRAPVLPVWAAVLVLGAGALAGCGDDRQDLDPVAGRYETGASGDTVTVELPVGAVVLTIGDGADSVADDRAADGTQHDATGDHRYVPVSARLEDSAEEGISDLVGGAALVADLRVELGSRSVALPTPYAVDEGRVRRAPTTTWVPMTSDERDELTVTVSYDGLEQRIDADGQREPSAADAYYDGRAGRGDGEDCGRGWETRAGSTVEVRCRTAPTFSPYLPGLGWAAQGRTFVAVDIRINVVDVRVGGRVPPFSRLHLDTTLDDGEAVQPDPSIGAAPTPDTAATLVTTRYFDLPVDESAVMVLDADLWGVDARRSVSIARD